MNDDNQKENFQNFKGNNIMKRWICNICFVLVVALGIGTFCLSDSTYAITVDGIFDEQFEWAGFDFRTTTSGYASGDFGIDINGDVSYEYAIKFTHDLDPGDVNGSSVTFDLYEVSTWTDVVIPAHAESNPWKMDTGSLVSSMEGRFGFGDNLAHNADGGRSYVLEGAFSFSDLTLYSEGPVTLHWTM